MILPLFSKSPVRSLAVFFFSVADLIKEGTAAPPLDPAMTPDVDRTDALNAGTLLLLADARGQDDNEEFDRDTLFVADANLDQVGFDFSCGFWGFDD